MIAGLFAVALLMPRQDTPTAASLISKMLAHYGASKDCKTLTGTITLTVSAGGESSTMDTIVQFEKPSLLYIKQSLRSGRHEPWIVISDGKQFSYNRPETLPFGNLQDTPYAKERLYEPVDQNGVIYTVDDIYLAASASLRDKTLPLDIAIGRDLDLRQDIGTLATYQVVGRDTVRGKDAYVVAGWWRQYEKAPKSDKYRLWITADGDLLRYEITGLTEIPDQTGRGTLGTMRTLSVWDVDLKASGEVDPALFKQ